MKISTMFCCSSNSAHDKLQPYQLRALYVRQIARLSQKGIFGQAINVFKEISKNIGVSSKTKRLCNLAVSDLLSANEFLVDRDAHRYLQRLQEALRYRNERQIGHLCKLLLKHFDFDPTSDVMDDLEKANKETLSKSDLSVISIYGLDLSKRKNMKKLTELLCRCPKIKKIELVFCSLDNVNAFKLIDVTMTLKSLYFIGLRGNQIDMKAVLKFFTLLKDPNYFPNLLWVDLRNNDGIITIPSQFVQLLMERRKKHIASKNTDEEKTSFSVQDAMNGKVV